MLGWKLHPEDVNNHYVRNLRTSVLFSFYEKITNLVFWVFCNIQWQKSFYKEISRRRILIEIEFFLVFVLCFAKLY